MLSNVRVLMAATCEAKRPPRWTVERNAMAPAALESNAMAALYVISACGASAKVSMSAMSCGSGDEMGDGQIGSYK